MPTPMDLSELEDRYQLSSFLVSTYGVVNEASNLQTRISELKQFMSDAVNIEASLLKEMEEDSRIIYESKMRMIRAAILGGAIGIAVYIISLFLYFGVAITTLIALPFVKLFNIFISDNSTSMIIGYVIAICLVIVVSILIGGGVGAVVGYMLINKKKRRVEEISQEVLPVIKIKKQNTDNEVGQCTASLKKILEEEGWMIQSIPQKYCYSDALKYMSEVLENGRASNFGSAMSLYEEALHRWKIEEAAALTRITADHGVATAADAAISSRAARRKTAVIAGGELYRLVTGR